LDKVKNLEVRIQSELETSKQKIQQMEEDMQFKFTSTDQLRDDLEK